MPSGTLCVPLLREASHRWPLPAAPDDPASSYVLRDAERRRRHSHAERGNEGQGLRTKDQEPRTKLFDILDHFTDLLDRTLDLDDVVTDLHVIRLRADRIRLAKH